LIHLHFSGITILQALLDLRRSNFSEQIRIEEPTFSDLLRYRRSQLLGVLECPPLSLVARKRFRNRKKQKELSPVLTAKITSSSGAL